MSQAQRRGPKSGDCCPESSEMLLLMAPLPHRHKHKSAKTEARPGVLCIPCSPRQSGLWGGAVAVVWGSLATLPQGQRDFSSTIESLYPRDCCGAASVTTVIFNYSAVTQVVVSGSACLIVQAQHLP